MRRFLWVLPVLLLATSAWGKETWVGFSVRPARDGTSPCDYEAEVGVRLRMFSGEIERERQNGDGFINKRATLGIPVGRILAAGEYNDIPERSYHVAAGAALWRAAQGLSVGAGLESFDEGFHSWHPTSPQSDP